MKEWSRLREERRARLSLGWYTGRVAKYDYIALDSGGKRVTGVLAASNESALLAELESRRLTPMSVRERGERGGLSLRRGVGRRPMGQAYTQVADLLRAGVPLLRAIRLIAGRKKQTRLTEVYGELADRVAAGDDLAAAMDERPDVFPAVHVAMVRAGERGGFLERVLARLGSMVIAEAELRGKVLGALAYPAFLVVVGVVIIAVVFTMFVPQFRKVVEEANVPLPTITKIVFGANDIFRWTWPGLVAAAVVIPVAVVSGLTRPGVREWVDVVKARLPVVGPLVRTLAAARFCRMLGTMLDNGVPLLAGMSIAKDAAGNVLMERAISTAAEAVRAGQPLSGPLGESGLFEDDVVEMIAVAESANNLDEVLLSVAETSESRVDRLISTAVRLVEPVLLVFLAGSVGMIAAALVIPMTKMGRAM